MSSLSNIIMYLIEKDIVKYCHIKDQAMMCLLLHSCRHSKMNLSQKCLVFCFTEGNYVILNSNSNLVDKPFQNSN